MADKFSRRSFLKGTGKTILTAGALSSGIGLSTSTTPKTVAISQKGIRWTNLNVLSPKAKAYRSYLKGIRALGGPVRSTNAGNWQIVMGGLRRKIGNIITKKRITPDIQTKSSARVAFEDATKKQRVVNIQGNRVSSKQLRSWTGNEAYRVAGRIAPNPESKVPPSQRTKEIWERNQKSIAGDLTKSARKELARELRKEAKGRRAERKAIRQGKGAKMGGGGKMALPGLQSAKNPTGMSLITQRYTL